MMMRIQTVMFSMVVIALGVMGEKLDDLPLFSFPTVRFGDLLTGDKSAALQVVHTLTTLGGLEITGVPNFEESRSAALQNLAICLEMDPNSPSIIMKDDSRRLTTAGSTSVGMTSDCGEDAANLRAITDGTMHHLLRLLDVASGNKKSKKTPLEHPAYTFEDIGRFGEHLEHMHSYFPSKYVDSGDQDSELTMDLHTDSGLFIAMTTGYYTSYDTKLSIPPANGLFIQLPSGQIAQVETADSSLIVMVGEGGSKWLAPVLGTPLRALPHALKIPTELGAAQAWSRSWYGKMYLPPPDAVLSGWAGVTYGQYRRAEVKAVSELIESGERHATLPAACGRMSDVDHATMHPDKKPANRAAETEAAMKPYSHIVKNDLCGSDNSGVMCWTQCMDPSSLPCGTQAECVDTATGEVVDGNEHCPESDMSLCQLECVGDIDVNGGGNSTESNSDFCYGNGVTMYMDGFYSTLQEEKGDTACVNLFFTEWTLDKSSKFCGACFGIFTLAVFVEFLGFSRRNIMGKMEWSILRDVIMVVLHGLQAFLGYLLMLAAMTYNVELFVMVILGLMCGYACFNRAAPPKANIDPCCAETGTEDVYNAMNEDSGKSDFKADRKSPLLPISEAAKERAGCH